MTYLRAAGSGTADLGAGLTARTGGIATATRSPRSDPPSAHPRVTAVPLSERVPDQHWKLDLVEADAVPQPIGKPRRRSA